LLRDIVDHIGDRFKSGDSVHRKCTKDKRREVYDWAVSMNCEVYYSKERTYYREVQMFEMLFCGNRQPIEYTWHHDKTHKKEREHIDTRYNAELAEQSDVRGEQCQKAD